MDSTEFIPDFEQPAQSRNTYSEALREVAVSSVDLIHKELGLVRAEFAESARRVREHTVEVAVFGALLFISIVPFLAFLVIALGEILDRQYGLSSLIVAIVCAALGGGLAARAYKKIKEEDVSFSRSKVSLEQTLQSIQKQIGRVKTAVTPQGDRYGTTSRI